MRAIKYLLFKIQIVSLVLLGISVMAISLSGINVMAEIYKSIQIYIGVLFWLSLIIFLFISINLNANRKKNRQFRMKYPHIKQIGIINFFKNKQALLIDVIMIINLVFMIVVIVFFSKLQALSFILLGAFVISFGLHCILNGVNYIYIKQLEESKKWRK